MFIADLHIHSRYSRATSKDGTPEYLDFWARRKGIDIIGSGDFTHPAWRDELAEKLIPAEDGLYRLKEEYRLHQDGAGDALMPRFVVSGEISSIYKKNGKTRKVHSLILLPGLEEAELLSKKLETIGNIHSDGRPILGLDCRDLLEITLEICPEAIYVPAHIWTPHFSLFGACSGFDTIEECYEDLTPYIHALETGLSSDPPMNWRWSALDRFQLISNSDAHSPSKLGREANLLNIDLSYNGLSQAIQTGEGLAGTIEFFPEEGKYHYDGHRKCHLCLAPLEAEKRDGICPVCGRKLTTGVSHRIEQLADRDEGFSPAQATPFESLVPLLEVIAASLGCSAASIKVKKQYEEMVQKLGPEFQILRELPLEDIHKVAGNLVTEGVNRLRAGKVKRNPGYDGEYGTIKLFDAGEIDLLLGEGCLFSSDEMASAVKEDKTDAADSPPCTADAETTYSSKGQDDDDSTAKVKETLNEQQQEAVETVSRAIAVIAGPGTGKTKTLVARTVHLLNDRRVKASEITAVTFTKKAAAEMKNRLEKVAGGKRVSNRVNIGTFHSLCYQFLQAQGKTFMLATDSELSSFAQEALIPLDLKIKPKQFLRLVSLKKTGMAEKCPTEIETEPFTAAYDAYEQLLTKNGIMDFDDLLLKTIELFEAGEVINTRQYSYLLVDEFQDINPLQYQLIKAWNKDGKELFVIGDPDQAIYSFRGSDDQCFDRLAKDYARLHTVKLTKNYRSQAPIISGAMAVIDKNEGVERNLLPVRGKGKPIRLVTAISETAEDIFVAKEINRLVGGIDMLDATNETGNRDEKPRGFGEIAILYRTHRQEDILEKCLKKEGIPYVVAGRDAFLGEEPVESTINFFHFLIHPEDQIAYRRCLQLFPENSCAEELLAFLKEKYEPRIKKESPKKLLLRWQEERNLADTEAMGKLLGMSLFYKTMPEFLDALTFGSEGDLKRCGGKTYTAEAVTLMTLHGAKGLEFPVVMICGVRKEMIPFENKAGDTDPAEERRLFYVGMTRAEEELILISSAEPSPFLADIQETEMIKESAGGQKQWHKEEQLSLF